MEDVKADKGMNDGSINKKYNSLVAEYLKSMNSSGKDVDKMEKLKPSDKPVRKTDEEFKRLLEAMDEVQEGLEETNQGMENDNIPDTISSQVPEKVNDKELLDKLNSFFTPILVMQGFENDISDKANLELSEAYVLNERTMINFDDKARMAQLISICALLIAQKKNTNNWQMFKKAAAIKTKSKLDIQKEEYDDALSLAQKYLVMVSTTNSSSVARDIARELLPLTQQ